MTMEPTKNAPQILFSFRCSGPGKHGMVRKSKVNNSPCTRCAPESSFLFVAEVPRSEGETETMHFYRAATAKGEKK